MPTVGLNIARVDDPKEKCKLVLWDLGGQKGLRVIWDKYYEEAHAVLWLVDRGEPGRVAESRDELRRVLRSPELAGAPVLVLANGREGVTGGGLAAADTIEEALDVPGQHPRGPYRFAEVDARGGAGVRGEETLGLGSKGVCPMHGILCRPLARAILRPRPRARRACGHPNPEP